MASDVSVDRTVRLVVSLIFFVDVCISFVWLCPWSQEDQRKVMQCTFLRKWTGLSISELSLCRGQRGQRDMAADGYKTSEPTVEEWQQTVDELKQVDQTIEELREELRQFEVRRNLIAGREALLRQRLAAMGQVLTPTGAASTRGSDASEASPSREPVIFNLDDDGAGLPKLTRPTSLEDWEQGLEMLNTAQTRDRQASLRAHWLLSGKNAANSPVQKR